METLEETTVPEETTTTPFTPEELRTLEHIKQQSKVNSEILWSIADTLLEMIGPRGENNGTLRQVASYLQWSEPVVSKARDTADTFPRESRRWDLPYWAYERVRKEAEWTDAILDEFTKYGERTNGTDRGRAITPAALTKIVWKVTGRQAPSDFDKLHRRFMKSEDAVEGADLTPEEVRTLKADWKAVNKRLNEK